MAASALRRGAACSLWRGVWVSGCGTESTAPQQGAAPDRLQLRSLRSFLASVSTLPAAGELSVGLLARGVLMSNNFDMESAILKWKEPPAAQRWKRRPVQLDRRVATLFNIWDILFALCILFVGIYILVQSRYDSLFFFCCAVILMWVLDRVTSTYSKVTSTYSVGDDGLRFQNGFLRKHYKWSEIEWFVIEALPQVPDVSWLRFKAKQSGKLEWPLFYFDRQQIDEQTLMGILNRYLPSKQLSA